MDKEKEEELLQDLIQRSIRSRENWERGEARIAKMPPEELQEMRRKLKELRERRSAFKCSFTKAMLDAWKEDE